MPIPSTEGADIVELWTGQRAMEKETRERERSSQSQTGFTLVLFATRGVSRHRG